jgi:predicted ArsR family transcriptional regulator
METADWDIEGMRTWSKTVFRRDHRLAVAVASLEAGKRELYAEAIAEQLDLTSKEVGTHLRDFERAGLLVPSKMKGPTSKQGGRPGGLFVRTQDDFWNCLQELGERFRRTR